MLKDKMICVRLKRNFHEDPAWAYVGKCIQWTEDWLVVDGRGIMILRGRNRVTEVDEKLRRIIVPRENVASIQQLPDTFNVKEISIGMTGSRLTMTVEGGVDCVVSEAD